MQDTPLDWSAIDTVFLDMDGTLLDLHYDNKVWNDLLPAAYAERHAVPVDHARNTLTAHMREIHGSIEFYSFDYWSSYTELDIIDLHRAATELVSYRPGAEAFLEWLTETGRTGIIATNAHRDSVSVKHEHSDICARVHAVVSSHDYKAPKESQDFWRQLHEEHAFAPERTLFVDDNEPVLEAAHRFGIRFNFAIRTPDSRRPARNDLSFPSFDDFREICPEIG